MKSPCIYCEIEVGIFFILFILLFLFVLLFLVFSVFLR